LVDLGSSLSVDVLSMGRYHSCSLFETGNVKCWGGDGFGTLGGGSNYSNQGDDSGEMGDYLRFTELGSTRYVIQISAGYYHTVFMMIKK